LGDARELIEDGCVDIIQADLTHFGGFLAMKRLAGWADAHGLPLAPHNVCGPVGTAANLHFAVATTNYKILEHFNDFADAWVHGLVDDSPRVDPADGCFALPEKPGLGVRLDRAACAQHPATGSRLQLFKEGWERRDPAASPGQEQPPTGSESP
jgi:galactonate dehydratase